MTRIRAVLIGLALVITNILGIVFLIPDNVSAEVYVSGSISGDTTWTAVNSPYIVVDNVTVESGVTLTIEPGVEVKFNGSYSLIVNGILNATGTASAPINFTSNQTTPSKGDWEGIRLLSANNTLDYCQILWGNNPLFIQGSNTNNSIKNCTIFNNTGDGIYLNNTSFNTIVNITVYSNDGYGIIFNSSENNTIENSAIKQNNLSGIYFDSSGYNSIEYTNISNNNQDAIYLVQSIYNTFRYNILIDNNWTGINLTSSSNNIIEINNITSNDNSGIFITGSSYANRITRNDISDNLGDGVNISGSTGNLIHHNNLDSNGQNAYDSTNQLNSWDDGMEGNWWSDYGGFDGDGDGIGDTPYDVPGGGSKDHYPLVNPMNINAPIIEGTNPINGTLNVSVTTLISITFSNEMNRSATENATSISGGLTPTNFAWSNNNMTMTFEPSLALDSETTYEVNLSTAAKDLLENTLHVDYQFVFTTEDADPPEITSTTPVNGSNDIAINANIVLVFSEAINDTTVAYSSSPDPGGWSVVWSAGNTTATYSHNDFDSETLYTFEITAAKDLAGNDLAVGAVPNPFEFTTEDAIAPQISSTTPVNGTIDVLITADIVVVFNEEMNISTVTYTCTPDPLGWSVVWSVGNTTATFSHNDFDSETLYVFEITAAKDVAGNDLVAGAVPNPWEFTTEDAVAPHISSTTPVYGTIDVLVTADIVVVFNEEMNTSTVTYTCTPDPLGWSVVWSAGNTTATYSHNDFDSETLYIFEITAAKDLAGNDLVAGAVPNPWEFTTEDVVAPQISSTTPANGTVDVLITADIVVVFNEEMNTSTVTYTCTPDPLGWSVVWSGGNTTATYSHNDFDSETFYTFEITGAKDVAGNDLVAGVVPNPWEFTTEDVVGPQISSTAPVNGTIDVLITADIVVTFSEEMNTSTVTYACTPDPLGWSVVWSGGNTTATYSHNNFESNTTYTFEITGGKDTAGNDLVAGVVPNPWEFTSEDVQGPQITSTTPSHGSIDVLIMADVVVAFSEEMNTSTVTYTCTPDPLGWSVVWSGGNTTATFSHNNFNSETLYIFEITGGKDLAGNDLVAGAVPNPWTFTTEDVIAPQISSTAPVNGTIDVSITVDIVVTFSEEMNTSTVTYTCTPEPLGWSVVWSGGNTTATYSHNDFDSETLYTFEITGAKDVAGNDLVAGAVPNPWIFTTADVIEPEISSTTPSNDTIDVLITADIVVTFSEEMNTSSVAYSCSPDPLGWSVVWSGGNTTATYSHNDFASETLYTFEITGAKDIAGNDLVAGVVPNPWEFTSEDVIAPEISSTTPVNSTIDILVTANIVVVFSEEMNTSSVTYTCSPDPGGWSVVWSGGNTTVTYSHNDFNSETTYTFEITAAKDPAGNDLIAGVVPNPWTFTTEDVIAPEISSTNPANGIIDVLITNDIVVTFSEEMNTSSVVYTCSPDPGGWSVVWSGGNTTATYSHNDFNSETTYAFEITAAKDLAGNDLVAGVVPNPWTFTTEDVIEPEISSTIPSNGAIDVLITTNIEVNFSEEMNTSSVTYTCTPDPGGWIVVWSGGNTIATYSHNDFASETTYTFEITAAKDPADNALVAGAVPNPWTFTTEDVVGPQISSTVPVNGTIDVLITANIVVTFTEEMNTSSVTYTCIPDPSGWSVVWSGGNTIATYSHNDFDGETIFTFEITGAKDIAGNDLAAGAVPNPWSFTTEDVQAPTISSTTPANGTLNVAQTANIAVTFSEAMNTSSVSFLCSPNPGGWIVTWSSGDTVATFTHDPFDDYNTYNFHITGGKDLADNNLASGVVPNPWSFTTTDSISPSILTTSPINGSENIGLTQNVIMTFSEAMNTSSLTYSCFPDPGGWSVVWSSGDTVATLSHIAFNDKTTYTFFVANVKDPAGNNLAAGALPNPWKFTTLDATSPAIVATSPSNNSVSVAQTANIVVTFSEKINVDTLAFLCTPDPGGWSASWNVLNTTVTLIHNAFDEFTSYTFSIVVAEDIAGNTLGAGAVPNPWVFKTKDITAPFITATTPRDGTLNIGLNQNLIITFSEAIDNSTVTYTCIPDPGGWIVTWSGGNTVATFSHNPFDSDTAYTFQVTAAKDMSGNNLVAGAVPNPWTFTTLDSVSPSIILSSPSDGFMDVVLDQDVIVTFNEAMNTSSVIYTSIPDPGGWYAVWSAGDTVCTFSHDNFDKSTGYTFQIISGKDIAGNTLVAGAVPNPFSFTTVDNVPPTILSSPILTATEEVQYNYDVEAIDGDGGLLTYVLTTFPTGMTINSTTGLITWTPTNSQVGANSVVVLVSDEDGGTDFQSFTITVVNENDSPTISSTPVTTATEDVQYTYDVDASDIDGDSLTYSLSTYPTGMMIDNVSGLISWTPTNAQVGANSVVVVVSDGNGGTDTQSFTITVTNTNDAPTIISTPIITATEDEMYIYDADANDVDVGDTLTFSLTAYPTGMIIDSDTGVIEWTPTNAQVGLHSVTLEVRDGSGSTDTQSFTITVANVNDSPTITSTQITTATEDMLYSYDVEASDIDGDVLTFSLSTYPAGMTIDNSSGLITWVPTNFQVGDNAVVVLVSDGKGGSDSQSFSITVINANDPPTITSVPIISAIEDSQYIYDVDASDIDSSDTLSFILAKYPTGMTIDGATGMIEWTPTNNQVGANSVVVVVLDGNGGNDTQSFTITVMNTNDAPEITSSPITSATEDQAYTYDVDATDLDGDPYTFSLSTFPAGMSIDGASGLITWTPTNSHVGPNGVVVLVSDGNGGNDTQSFTITVANTNDVPTITSTPITSATEDQPYTYDVEATDIDVSDTLSFSLTSYPIGMTIDGATGVISWTPTNAQVGTNSVTVLVSDGNSGTDSQAFTITVTNTNDPPNIISSPITTATEDTQYSYDVEATDLDVGDTLSFSLSTSPSGMTIDSSTGLILWTPINSQVGTNNVVVWVVDGNGGSDTQSFTITVTNTNDPPTITSTPVTTATDDVMYTYDVEADDIDIGDTLTFGLSVFPTGMTIDTATGLIEWTPNDDHIGPNSVTVLVYDGNGGSDMQTFAITVTDANDQPTIISTAPTTAIEDSPYTYDLDVLDPDNDMLNFSLTTNPIGMTIDSATGLISWTPTNDHVGSNNVVVLVIDGKGGSDTQSFSVTVTNTNDPPNITSIPVNTAVEDLKYSYEVEAIDIDSGDTLSFGLTTVLEGMQIDSATGMITWTPTNNHVGANNVEVFVIDGNGGNDTQVFTITVSNSNDAPTITSTPITVGFEDTVYTYDLNATDVDLGDTLTYSLTTYPDGMTIDETTGVITWTPTNSQVGANSVTARVVDGSSALDVQPFSIMVINVNDPPTIISTAVTTATQDALYIYNVVADDIDVGDTLTYSLTAFPEGMTINSSTGSILWTPTDAHVGGHSVTLEVFDESGEVDSQTFIITVANINDPPTFTSQPVTTATEEVEYFYEVEAQDLDDDTLTYSLLSYPEGMVIDSASGTISWTPTNEQVGAIPITARVIDGKGGDAKQAFTINVENVNDPPTFTSNPITDATEEEVYAYIVQAEDIDPTHDNLTYELSIYPLGMIIDPKAGIISWTPTDNQVGDNRVIVIVSDGNGGSDTHSFLITVQNVNDAPIFTSIPVSSAFEEIQYSYDVNAVDADLGDTLTYNLTVAPDGMTIEDITGIIKWTPTDAQVDLHQIIVKVTDDHDASTTQSFAITVENVNDAPMMFDMMVVPKSGSDKDIYTFSLTYLDPDGDPGIVKVIIDSGEYIMERGSGVTATGEIYTVQVNLVARNHTYYFVIDDGEGHVVVSDVAEISVVASEDEDKDLLPIPDWLLILILVVIIVCALIYLVAVKRKLKKQKRILQMAEEYHRNQMREQELRSAGVGAAGPRPPLQKIEKSFEPEEPDESDDLDEPLLDFSK